MIKNLKSKQYYCGIDSLKGTLIILVILGHLIQGELTSSLSRYLIYSFHMPLFLAVSGYLLRRKLGELRLGALIKKYFFRVFLPWLIAVATYYVVQHHAGSFGTLLKGFVRAVLIPQYHLWFISSLLLFVGVLYVLLRLSIPTEILLLIGVAVALLVHTFYPVEQPLREIFNTYRFSYFLFFIMGFWLRNSKYKEFLTKRAIRYALPGSMFLALLFQIRSFFSPSVQLLNPYFYLLNLLLAAVAIPTLKTIAFGKIAIWLGKNSLPIYLWHVAVIAVAKPLMSVLTMPVWYVLVASLLLLQLVIIWLLTKQPFINRYFFGRT